MTAVYLYRPDTDRFRGLTAVSNDTYVRLRKLGQDPVKNWRAPNLRWIGAEARSDFPNLAGHFPVISERALEVLGDLLGPDTEVLKVNTEGGGYVGLHIRSFPNCLDTVQSEIEWLEPGQALMISKYVFYSEALPGCHLFRIKELALAHAFLSDTAVDAIKSAGLVGLFEQKLWPE